MFGRGYVIDHVLASLRQEAKERRYRAYVTDSLRVITENTARSAVGGTYITKRWIEVETHGFQEDERSGDEVAADVIRRIGLTFAEAGETNG